MGSLMKYSLTNKRMTLPVNFKDGESISVLFDPFSAFYLPNVEIDYLLDYENNVDGFVINNPDQDLHKGKFWVQKELSSPL